MKFYKDSVFIATVCLTVIACVCIYRMPSGDAKEIVTPIVTGICGFVTGYASHALEERNRSDVPRSIEN